MILLCYIMIALMTFMGSVASLLLKKASGFNSFGEIIRNWNLYVGGGLYVLSALLNIYVLQFMDYSIVLPLTSFTYVWTMILAYFVLKEGISRRKIFGVILVVLGAFAISITG